jgi:hypothetical protein
MLLVCRRGGAAAESEQEQVMAKGQAKSNKETKKPKADKNQPKTNVSAYKQAQGKGIQPVNPFAKKS